MEGDGTGGLTITATLTTETDGGSVLALADLNHDGSDEIIWHAPHELLVLDTSLSIEQRQPSLQGRGIATGDFNGDGFLDIALEGFINLYLFDGDGSGQLREARTLLENCCFGFAASADLDLDGATDLLASHTFFFINAEVRVFLNRNGTLQHTRMFATGSVSPNEVEGVSSPLMAVADVNRDGAPDIISTYQGQIVVAFAYP
jgi:hypothetical protein